MEESIVALILKFLSGIKDNADIKISHRRDCPYTCKADINHFTGYVNGFYTGISSFLPAWSYMVILVRLTDVGQPYQDGSFSGGYP